MNIWQVTGESYHFIVFVSRCRSMKTTLMMVKVMLKSCRRKLGLQ